MTGRMCGRSLAAVIYPLGQYLRGWRAYFGFCQSPWELRDLDGWVRRRLRCMVWKLGLAPKPIPATGVSRSVAPSGSLHGSYGTRSMAAESQPSPVEGTACLGLLGPGLTESPMLTQDITNLNRRVRTRTHGGVTGKTREGLPMSIPGRRESASKPGVPAVPPDRRRARLPACLIVTDGGMAGRRERSILPADWYCLVIVSLVTSLPSRVQCARTGQMARPTGYLVIVPMSSARLPSREPRKGVARRKSESSFASVTNWCE